MSGAIEGFQVTGRDIFRAIVLVALAAGFTVVPLADLVMHGPFRWHFTLPSAVEGGLELLVVIALLFGALSLPATRWRLPVAALVLAAYLRRHHADIAAVSSLTYLELLLAAGACALRVSGSGRGPHAGDDYLRSFVAGIAVVAALFLCASLAGFGRAADLRFVLLFTAPLLFAVGRTMPLFAHVALRLRDAERPVRAIACVLLAWIAATFARTGNVFGFDSAWYGLRGHVVLAPEHSLFDVTGLVSPVYYFPKLYELLLLPLNGLATIVVAFGLTIAVYIVFVLAAWRTARVVGADREQAAWATLLAASLPVVANHALSAKPDLLALTLLLVATRFILSLATARSARDGLLALAALLFATQCKLGAGAFCAPLGIVLVVLAWRRWRATSFDTSGIRHGIVVLALAVGVTALLTWRTWLLTGLPTIGPDPLYKLWLALGFHVIEPVGTLNWLQPQDWSDVPSLVVDQLFRPSRLSHIQVTWTGNAWLWCLLALAPGLVVRRGTPRPQWNGAALAILALVSSVAAWLAFGQGYEERGGDGNYFMLAPVLLMLFLLPRVPDVRSWAIRLALTLFAAMQLSYAFVSAEWGMPGTHAWERRFNRPIDALANLRFARWDAAGMLPLAKALDGAPHTLHVVGDLPEGEGYLLPVRFEPLSQVYYSHRDRFESPDSLQHLLDVAGVDALVVSAPGAQESPHALPAVREITARWRADPRVERIVAGKYELLLRRADESIPTRR